MKLHFLMITLLLGSVASARIDAATGNFTDTWVDLDTSSSLHLSLARTYNSRSQVKGLFGYGWCSYLETRLEKLANGNLQITECGSGQSVEFKKLSENQWAVEKQTGRNMKLVQGGFQELTAEGTTRIFRSDGRIDKIKMGLTGTIDFGYDDSRQLTSIHSSKDALQLRFTYNQGGFVSAVEATGLNKASYEYKNDNLVKVTNAWKNSYEYKYDLNHNLNAIIYPDKTSDVITYDAKRDWVTGFTSRFGCAETLTYPDDPGTQYSVTLDRDCGTLKQTFKLSYKVAPGPDGKIDGKVKVLEETVSSAKQNVTREYSAVTGQLISASGSEMPTQKWVYGLDGRLSSYSSGINSLEFGREVNQCPDYVAAKRSGYLDKTETLATFKYTCTPQGQISDVTDEHGLLMSAKYDSFGRPVLFKIRGSPDLKLTYKHGERQPASLSQDGIGQVNFEYGQQGELKQRRSKLEPQLEFKVRDTFSQGLQLMRPVEQFRGAL